MIPREVSLMNRWRDEGVPLAAIARRLGRSRQTLYNWLEREREGWTKPKRRASKLDPHKSYIESRLEQFNLPATVLLGEIQKRGYEGGITILREFVAEVKNREVRRLVDRFETEPGRQAQIDWASCGTIEHEGRRRRLSLFVLVLGFSRILWARFVVSERRPVMFECLEQAFRELGGVSKELLVDNMKQAVEVARTPEEPAQLQQEFASFAEHWGFEVLASPPYWPQVKGKVERSISYLKGSFLEGRSFHNLDDLNQQLRQWLAEVANARVHGTTKERPIDRLELDQEALLPLRERAFPSSERGSRQVDHDGFLSFGGVRYSVDPSILRGRRGERVDVHVSTTGTLRIFHGDRCVGEHPRVPSGSPAQEDPRHAEARRELRQEPRFQKPWGRAPRFEQVAETVDFDTLIGTAPIVEQRPLSSYSEGV